MAGWVIVLAYAVAIVAVVVTTRDGELRPGDRGRDRGAASELVAAWERSLEATFLRTGTFERRSEITGAVISSEDVLAQRPPRRIHRQLGGVDGRDDRRAVLCPSVPEGGRGPARCSFSDPTLPSYEEDMESVVAALRSLVEGADPVYAVERAGEGCFDLAQQRVEPRAPFGVGARFCFDAATGAPTDSRVRYAGGIVEVVAVVRLSGEVDDADLEP